VPKTYNLSTAVAANATAYPGYSTSGLWVDNGVCKLHLPRPDQLENVDFVTNRTQDMAFNFAESKWIKIKDASFNNRSLTANRLPPVMVPYDSYDNDTSPGHFMLGKNGVSLGLQVGDTGRYAESPRNWYDTVPNVDPNTYVAVRKITQVSQQIEYVQQRKDSLDQPTLSTTSKNIEIIHTSPTLTDSQVSALPSVLMVDGDVMISGDFNTAKRSLAVIATGTITFSATTISANGIFIADKITVEKQSGNTSKGLKINGNVIGLNKLVNDRTPSDTAQPSIFVIFNPKMYIDMLPSLSQALYDWKQLQ